MIDEVYEVPVRNLLWYFDTHILASSSMRIDSDSFHPSDVGMHVMKNTYLV